MQFGKSNFKIKSQKGANLVEYSLMLALIAIIVAGSVRFLGFSIAGTYAASAMQLGECGEPVEFLANICVNGGNCFDQYIVAVCAIEEEGIEEIG